MIFWLMGALCFAEPTPEDEERAKELYANGEALYAEGDYENALVAFEAAYALSPAPLLLFNMANALERMGNFEGALEKLNKYRAFAPSEERDTLERRIRNMEKRIASAQPPGSAPAPVPEPAPERQAAVAEPVVPAPAPRPDKPFPVLPVAGYSAGAVGLTIGTVYGVRTLGVRDRLAETCVDGLCPPDAEADLNADRSYSLVADIGWTLATVGIAVGTVGLVVDGRERQGVVAGVCPGGVVWVARF